MSSKPFPVRHLVGAELPITMRELAKPPLELWLHGEFSARPKIAVVGTRRPTPEARLFTGRLVRDLARAGASIVSGGALGIDAIAHEAALAAGGHTLVVAPAGLERPYPESHRGLFTRVLDSGGGYLSVVPEAQPASLGNFFVRNGVLAALVHVVVAIESSVRGGTRNTTAHARRLGRPIFWPPAAPWEGRRRGFLAEYRLGGVTLLSDARDVLAYLEQQRIYCIAETDQLGAELESVFWEGDGAEAGRSGGASGSSGVQEAGGKRGQSRGGRRRLSGALAEGVGVLFPGENHRDQGASRQGSRSSEGSKGAAHRRARRQERSLAEQILDYLVVPSSSEELRTALKAEPFSLERELVALALAERIERLPDGRWRCLSQARTSPI